MQDYSWYQQIIKPFWAPPAWLFGPVWTVLYVIVAVSFGYVGYLFIRRFFVKRKIPFLVLLPFLLNVVFNATFTPIQFGLKNNLLATADILLVLATIIWFMSVIWKYSRWVVIINIPYLLWVLFATILQLTITVKNW